MSVSFLTNLDEQEFKQFLKEALREILSERQMAYSNQAPGIMDVEEAAGFLKIKIPTLYEKTSKKLIPHFKKGNKLYFNKAELEAWVSEGKVKTHEEIQTEAATYLLNKEGTHR